MPNQLLVADQQLAFVSEYLPEPYGDIGDRYIVPGVSMETQDLFVTPGKDMEMVKTIDVVFTLTSSKIGRNEALVWQYHGDLHVDDWLDKDPVALAPILKSACGAIDLEVHSVGNDRALVSAYFGKGGRG